MTILEKGQEQALENIYKSVSEQSEKINQFEKMVETFSQPVQGAGSVLAQPAEPKKEGRHDFGDFCYSIYKASQGNSDAQAHLYRDYNSCQISSDGVHTQVLSEATGTGGGYLVPQEFLNELFNVAAETAVIRPRARVMRMASRSMVVPAVDLTDSSFSAGDTQFFGGVKATWIETDTEKTSTQPAFRNIEFVAHELSGYTEVGNGLLADSGTALGPFLNQSFSGAINWYEDYAFLRGSGSGEPLGILNAPCLKKVARDTDNDFTLADAAEMLQGLLPASHGAPSTVWIMNITLLEKLVQFSTANTVVWIPNARQALPMTLFGIPVIFTEKTPSLNTAGGGDVILADLSYYWIGDRQDSEISASIHANFTKNQTVWRFSHRVDGQPALNNVITLSDATTTVSPFVSLDDD
jgi:HK97 family phage major capsid protein